jgi:hypothetical protein
VGTAEVELTDTEAHQLDSMVVEYLYAQDRFWMPDAAGIVPTPTKRGPEAQAHAWVLIPESIAREFALTHRDRARTAVAYDGTGAIVYFDGFAAGRLGMSPHHLPSLENDMLDNGESYVVFSSVPAASKLSLSIWLIDEVGPRPAMFKAASGDKCSNEVRPDGQPASRPLVREALIVMESRLHSALRTKHP